MARIFEGNHLCLLLFSLLFAGSTVEALSYDYFASIECLEEPLEPQYGGGILVNPEFNQGLKGWSAFGSGSRIETRKSSGGNNFVVAHTRKQLFDSFSQKIYMEKEKLYTFSAWIQVNKGKESVAAVFKTSSEITHAGAVVAEAGCWSMLKGGLTVDSSGFVELYFESNNTSVEIWLDSVSLQPFTKKEWKSHQIQSIEKVRKRNVSIHVADASGKILDGATIHIKQNKPGFPFGSAISKAILDNTAYQNWFTPRFTVTTFENEMKWYVTEYNAGRVNYSLPDAMVQFVKQHGISIRGHNIFWDNPEYQPYWVKTLQPDQLKAAAERRINSVIPKYKGQVIAWDVMNENLHFSFFEDKLGKNASSVFYQKAYQLDPNTVMFMNEFNTLEYTKDSHANPAKYLEKLREIKAFSKNHGPIGIGLQGHFQTPNIPYVRASLDTLASVKLPIWLTELDVAKSPKQTQYLDEVLREVHSHPAVQGIVLWTIWHADGCRVLCLTDDNFKNLPAGDLVDKLINEWKQQSFTGTTDSNGEFETRLFHGDYDVIITHPSMNSASSNRFKVSTATENSFKVSTATENSEEPILHLQVNV